MSSSATRPVRPPRPRLNDARVQSKHQNMHQFWQRITEGMQLEQLWSQFVADAQSSYRFYSREVSPDENVPKHIGAWRAAKAFFWAVLTKLTPAKRLLLVIALVLLFFPAFKVTDSGWSLEGAQIRFMGGVILLVLLVLEVAERVTMKRDLEIAREIQLWLVPAAPPTIAGIDLAFINRPANTVAGDYYDVFFRRRPDGTDAPLLVVADVAGKSLPAALLMATFQASLKTLSATPCELTELVARVNQYACAHSNGGLRFTTAFFAEIDPDSRRLRYVNAGHNQPFLRRVSGECERLDRGGLPLGIQAGAPYDMGEAPLEPGDALFIFTDGLVEAENEHGVEYGENSLPTFMKASANASAQDALQFLMADVNRFVGQARQHDDITCLLAKLQ